ncbi:MAG: pilus assembly protein [Alphaproteobacteria bacterium]|jgi:Flp pilus assembly protein TadG|nr:pilus assembly protein [Alphaproteobacteria bacterium]
MSIRFSHLWRDRRGGAAIEFAFVGPVFIALMLGAVELGRMYYVRQSMEYATEQAARYYSLNPSAATTTITSQLNGFLPGRISSGVTVSYADTLNCNGNSNVKCTTLTVTYPFSYAESFLGFAGKTLTATSQAVRQF